MLTRPVSKKCHKLQAISFGALLVLLIAKPISNAIADNGDFNRSTVQGTTKTYGEWAARWWQWAFDTKFAQFGEGEVDCSAGQTGNVWFLAGSTTGAPASRTCTIVPGKILFFPLVNYGFWNPDDSCTEDPDHNCTVAQKRANANGFFSDQVPGNLGGSLATYACHLNATVNGIPVQNLGYPIVRTQSPAFPLTYPEQGVDDPQTIDDGYYVAIPPLKKGHYTIKFTGGVCPFDQSPHAIVTGENGAAPVFLVDVTYDLTVAGGSHSD